MVAAYDNWERLVVATLRREQLRSTALRTPSDISLASSSSSFINSNFTSFSPFNFSGDSFSYQQILRATDYLSSSNIIHLSGILYYGVLEDGIQVVVKKVDPSSAWQESLLRSELEFYGKVSHPRFVPLLGHCFENWNEKFLVYKYMTNKDLSSSISSLDWSTRLKIAIGVADGLCYLHHQCVPPLVHRHIEARSILIDENFEARLGRLNQVCAERKERNQSRILKLLRLPNGYGQGTSDANATCAYDVYCFGKVLLEFVTGKLVFTAGNDSTTRDWMADALAYITTYDKELLLHITDPSLIMDDRLFNEVWAVANIAKACVSPKPSERPQMTHIIEALRDPVSIRFSTRGRPQSGSAGAKMRKPLSNKLSGTSQATDNTKFSGSSTTLPTHHFSAVSDDEGVYLNTGDAEPSNLKIFSFSELKAATRYFRSDGLLGEGGSGRVYKGLLYDKSTSNGNSGLPIAVKRLTSESLQGFEEWQSEIDKLGRLSHPNLIKLLGSYSEDNKLMLVYEFMPKGSLHNHLFRSPAVQALPWDIRLKILTGAARGLAYMHAANIVHRGVQSSNILLDGDFNAKIADFGLARMGDGRSHVTTCVIGSYGYASPEYVLTGHVNLKSDVFGFGVVLAEMLTGLRSVDNTGLNGRQILIDWIWPQLIEKRRLHSIMDPLLEGKYSTKAAVEMAQLALMCLNKEPNLRPSMKQVVHTLENIASANKMSKEPRTDLMQEAAFW